MCVCVCECTHFVCLLYFCYSLVDFLNEIGCGNVKANYDSGNSSGLGYDAKDELEQFKKNLGITGITGIHGGRNYTQSEIESAADDDARGKMLRANENLDAYRKLEKTDL